MSVGTFLPSPPARTLMVQGTASSVGKSLLVTALCRLFRRAGVRVAPFKAQNMSLNAFVTPDGREIGRAQAVQAEAAGAPLSVDMNPVLLKPESDGRSQVVILGKAIGTLTAADYYRHKVEIRPIIAESLARLRAAYDLVVIEGAGSPAEINLKEHDLVNMHVARLADAPVLLVGDIDRGGVFASLVGTMELLERAERARVAAFVINKFRGDLSLLSPGLTALTARTGVPVLGVIPFVERLGIADEDGVAIEDRRRRDSAAMLAASAEPASSFVLTVAVVRLPRISNHDEVQPLEYEPGVRLRFVDTAEEVAAADLLILPGSKSTVADLAWLRARGLAEAVAERAQRGALVLGICGGCQMLGETIADPDGVESAEQSVAGLGLLPLHTRFHAEKTVAQVKATVGASCFLTAGLSRGTVLTGYEIHAGAVALAPSAITPFRLRERNREAVDLPDGAVASDGAVIGTMIHGLLENDLVRVALLNTMRARRSGGGAAPSATPPPWSLSSRNKEAAYDRLADVVSESLDLPLLNRIVGVR
ncbi:MAG TPA: cobyric acid synthase [Polyangia bacterium]|jgi:adenosylcobyric acid synthase|nr:cobyric acid synthase [Polyangia bacterium]